mmetsp:Transcript_10592/g.15953  ORF Transcript_10592/g.15953 Transcript_10592/m.15953 type:complete len:237 (-) Transcript_10592:255-965(-)
MIHRQFSVASMGMLLLLLSIVWVEILLTLPPLVLLFPLALLLVELLLLVLLPSSLEVLMPILWEMVMTSQRVSSNPLVFARVSVSDPTLAKWPIILVQVFNMTVLAVCTLGLFVLEMGDIGICCCLCCCFDDDDENFRLVLCSSLLLLSIVLPSQDAVGVDVLEERSKSRSSCSASTVPVAVLLTVTVVGDREREGLAATTVELVLHEGGSGGDKGVGDEEFDDVDVEVEAGEESR